MGRNPVYVARWILIAAWLAAVDGCTGTSAEHLVPVRGRITLNHQPVPSGTVVFLPDPDNGNTSPHEARGTLNAQGVYELKTNNRNGVAPGSYKVTVFALTRTSPQDDMRPEWLAPQRYSDHRTSQLTVEVVADPEAGRYDFDLKP